ncbi:DUF4214 domain-containing protein [Desulfobacter sp. UBA2225]|uniref:DUF4214 domain-containing protein n=1 Tax=Desulfobacter sp. UBA2225 TaxID=1961413 RepID=UPI002579E4C6|nr:DUF4214 domain-containing protein [Desulfobacter sp. UBA2225]
MYLQKHGNRISLFLLSIFLLVSTTYTKTIASTSDIEAFVTRFYQQCLDREPDPGGLNRWSNNLYNGNLTGADIAYGFVFSEEFQNLNTSDSEFVTILYRAFFNREPDIGGYNNWMNHLANGASRSNVLDGFTNSDEFVILCNNYGIIAHNAINSDNLTMEMLVGTYHLKAFTVVYDSGITLTQDNFNYISGTMSIDSYGNSTQTITINGINQTTPGDFKIINNETLLVSSLGYAYNMKISFIDNILTTYLASGTYDGQNYAETDVWEKISSSASQKSYSLSEPSEVEFSDGPIGGVIGHYFE